ncbi:MAG: hypothetical protein Q8O40_11590 [Chloroflexota bacterium]|nr:hypothetical protein [Chloroflexota bacterium]
MDPIWDSTTGSGPTGPFLKTCKPKAYRQVQRDGELDGWIELKVNAAKRLANNLMECGATPEDAWNRAVRSSILESETD